MLDYGFHWNRQLHTELKGLITEVSHMHPMEYGEWTLNGPCDKYTPLGMK